MLRITNQREVPPTVKLPDGREGRGFFYVQSESNHLMCCDYLEGLLRKVEAHRRANNYPLGTNWEAQVENWYCENNQGTRVCEPDRTGWDQPLVLIARFAKAMVEWGASGLKTVTAEQSLERWNVCRGTETTPRCPNYRGDKGWGLVSCGSCGCTGLHIYPATAKCPLGKWPAI
jgi:hypothetical protein